MESCGKKKYEDRLNSLDSKDPIKPQIQKALKQERKVLKESKELLNQLNLKHYNRRMPQSQQFIERYPKRGLKIYRNLQSTRKQIHELKNS